MVVHLVANQVIGVRFPLPAQMKSQPTDEYLRKQLKTPDWYVRLKDFLEITVFPLNPTKEELKIRKEFYKLVSEMLENNEIPLADKSSENPDFDQEREKIDTIVIHHTKEKPDVSLTVLSAIGLVRQYANAYLGDNTWGRDKLRPQPIWSSHFDDNNKMVFYAYHWLIMPSGTSQRLLKDRYIGRHSGIQSVNARSVAIAFSGDYTDSSPTDKQLKETARIIRTHYDEAITIVGHQDVRPDRDCPGKFWPEWKLKLINLSHLGIVDKNLPN